MPFKKFLPYGLLFHILFLCVNANAKVDAGVVALISSVNPCPGTYDIRIKIKNYGSNYLNSLMIGWQLNDSVTGIKKWEWYKGGFGFPAGDYDEFYVARITLDSGYNKLKIWTFLPDGVKDAYPYNDTIQAQLNASSLPPVAFFTPSI